MAISRKSAREVSFWYACCCRASTPYFVCSYFLNGVYAVKIFTIEDVVSSMLNADINPAYKAHATRRLNSYVKRRCVEINAKPTQVLAAVKAAVTKRKSKS